MIIEAQLGKGTQRIEVPDGSTPQQIDDILGHINSSAPKGFMDRLSADFNERKQQAANTAERSLMGEQGGGSTLLQTIGTGAGVIGDVAGNAIGSVARYGRDLVPQGIDDAVAGGLAQAGNYVANSAVGRGAKYLAQEGGELAGQYPVTATNLGSVANIAGLVPVGFAGKETADLAKTGAKNALEYAATPKQVPISSEGLRDLGRAKYAAATTSGEVYSKSLANNFVNSLEETKPAAIAGKYLSKEDKRYIDSLEEFKVLKDTNLSIDDIDKLDKQLTKKVSEAYRRGENFDAGQLSNAQVNLRNMVNDFEGGKQLDEARKLWTANYKMQDIERILQKAEGADSPAKAIQKGFEQLALNAKKIKAYSPKEVELIKKAAKTGIATDILKIAGSRLNVIGGGLMGGIDGGAGAYITSLAGRTGAGALQGARAGRVAKEVTGGLTETAEPTALNKAAQALQKKLTKDDLQKAFNAKKRK